MPAFLGSLPATYSVAQLQAMARNSAISYGLDPAIFMGLVEKESSWQIDVTNSKSSAFGLTQMTNAAQKDVGVTRSDLFGNAKAQLDAGAAYLKQQLNRFGNYDDALGAYNQGAGNFDTIAAQGYASDVNERSAHYLEGAQSMMDAAGETMQNILNFDIGKWGEEKLQDATGHVFDLDGWFGRIALGVFALILIAAALFMLAPKQAKEMLPIPV